MSLAEQNGMVGARTIVVMTLIIPDQMHRRATGCDLVTRFQK